MKAHSLLTSITLVASVAGCSYHELTSSDLYDRGTGYSAEFQDDGSYLVRYDGTAGSPFWLLRNHFERRAREICPDGYELKDYQEARDQVPLAKNPRWNYVQGRVQCPNPAGTPPNNSFKPKPLRGSA